LPNSGEFGKVENDTDNNEVMINNQSNDKVIPQYFCLF
jgi:hypothetical protein